MWQSHHDQERHLSLLQDGSGTVHAAAQDDTS
jgi:hypothetical protein